MAVSSQNNEKNVVSSPRKNAHIISSSQHMKSPARAGDGGRVHDSNNSKSCHQCRQKTVGVFASCNNRDKKCSVNFCRRCLLNRYGEKAEETAVLEDWKCPKCRGVCNCSICMKKRGHQPTGILVQTARATGFSSVLEMLQLKGTAGVSTNNNVKNSHASPDKSTVTIKAPPSSSRKYGKENSSVDPNVQCKPLQNGEEVKLKDLVGQKNLTTDNVKHNATTGSNMSDRLKRKNAVEAKVLEGKHVNHIRNEEKVGGGEGVLAASDGVKLPKGNKGTKGGVMTVLQMKKNLKPKKSTMRNHSEDLRSDVVLPEYRDLLTVGGVELSANDIGPAFQFLEFCSAFQQVLDLKKGQPEAVLRELKRGRIGRCGVYSSIVQFHIKLLSIIQEDLGEASLPKAMNSGNSWLQAIGKCIAESQFGSKQFPLDCFSRSTDWYNKLDSSEKLRLLNFLCDETLGTNQLRNWIDKEHSKYVEAKKEAKAKVLAAKEKEKLVKTKLKAQMIEALISSNGALSVSEHENLILKMRTETDKAHVEKLEAMAEEPKKNPMPNALRTEPILLDGDSHVHWRLRGYSERSHLVLQDIGKWDSVMLQDKWFTYDDDKQKAVETYVSLRKKRKREEAHVAKSPKLVRKLHSELKA